MKHFISIVIDNDGINESRDFVLDTVLNTANIGLLENTMEYEIYESENNTQVLSIPIARELNEKQQAYLELLNTSIGANSSLDVTSLQMMDQYLQ